jgi:hypothetical protein
MLGLFDVHNCEGDVSMSDLHEKLEALCNEEMHDFYGFIAGARIALQLALEEIKKREIHAMGTPLGIVTIKAVEGVFGEIGGE